MLNPEVYKLLEPILIPLLFPGSVSSFSWILRPPAWHWSTLAELPWAEADTWTRDTGGAPVGSGSYWTQIDVFPNFPESGVDLVADALGSAEISKRTWRRFRMAKRQEFVSVDMAQVCEDQKLPRIWRPPGPRMERPAVGIRFVRSFWTTRHVETSDVVCPFQLINPSQAISQSTEKTVPSCRTSGRVNHFSTVGRRGMEETRYDLCTLL